MPAAPATLGSIAKHTASHAADDLRGDGAKLNGGASGRQYRPDTNRITAQVLRQFIYDPRLDT